MLKTLPMPDDLQRLQAVFLAAVELPAADRLKLLNRDCHGNAELRREVEALLEAHDQPGSFLDSLPPGVDAATFPTVHEQPGDMIGPYKLLQQIGEGGFGVVFLAEQARTMRRRVALKIIKPGMDTRQVIARFEAERQALAMMDHANIARVYDAEATATGRPYFVMELVRGLPLTEYCDSCDLSTNERLRLFILVCQAVQHAHQKGVIHRDIKPTNVLVAMQDGRPTPKIIDFGIAKALSQRLTEHTLVTAFAQMVGTPLYMSPEQAEMCELGVDTRSDIYSLGVLLYELLTGTTPFDKDRLQTAGYDELRRIIREEEPPRPSARMSTLSADAADTLAQRHRTDRHRLHQSLRGELDWIVMKCLEKDRNRRYETVYGLARDVERYLNDEPVTACPPSAAYRFRKFARRHRAALLAAAATVATLLVLIAGLAVSNRLIADERALAEEQSQIAQELAHEEQLATNHARAEAAKSQAVVTLLQDMLAAAHPDSAGDKDLTVRALLDEFSKGLESQLKDQPEVEATLRQVIGTVYTRLRLVDQAGPHLRRSLEVNRELFGEDDTRYAHSLRSLAWNQLEKNRADTEVETLARSALEIYQQDDDSLGMLRSHWLLVLSLDGQSKTDEAETAANDALRLARERGFTDQPEVANLLHHLAWIKIRRGDYEAAEQLARESVIEHRRVHGDAHPETAFGWTYLGAALHRQGKLAEAEPCYRNALDIFRKSFPEDHAYIRPTFIDLLATLRFQGKFEEAVAEYERAVRLKPNDVEAHNELAWILADCPDARLRDPARAAEHALKAVEGGPNNGYYWHTLGVAQYRNGQWVESIDSLQRSAKLRDSGYSHDWFFLAMAAWQAGNREDAHQWYDKAVNWMEEYDPQDGELRRYLGEADKLLHPTEQQRTPPDEAENNAESPASS